MHAHAPDPIRVANGRYGAFKSWGQTVDRSARTRAARDKSPAGLQYWLDRLDPERFADATDAQRYASADAARKAFYLDMSRKAAAARRRKAVA